MLITFTHAYRPCWLANAIELCTKQTRNRVCVMHPLAVYKTGRCSLILPTKTLVRRRYVQFTYFMGRVYSTEQNTSFFFARKLETKDSPGLCFKWKQIIRSIRKEQNHVLFVLEGVKWVMFQVKNVTLYWKRTNESLIEWQFFLEGVCSQKHPLSFIPDSI